MPTIACVEMGQPNKPFRRHWTMLVELELTVLQSSPVALVFSPTLSKITVITLSIVISSERGKSKEAVTLMAPPRPALPLLPVSRTLEISLFPCFHHFFLILSFADFIFFLVGLWQLCPLVVSILLAPGTFSKLDSSVAFRFN